MSESVPMDPDKDGSARAYLTECNAIAEIPKPVSILNSRSTSLNGNHAPTNKQLNMLDMNKINSSLSSLEGNGGQLFSDAHRLQSMISNESVVTNSTPTSTMNVNGLIKDNYVISNMSPSVTGTVVSFTVPDTEKTPHHRYSISSKPGRSSQLTSPNGSTDNLAKTLPTEETNGKDGNISPSTEKNCVVHMPGDFIYFDPKPDFPDLPDSNSPLSAASSTIKAGTKERILPPSGPQIPYTEFLQKQDDKKFHILIGCTGSVATIKIPLLIDRLFKIYSPEKISIQLIVTKPAEHFLKGLKISTHVKIWREEDEWIGFRKFNDPILHQELRKWADVLLIAPLSANTLAKLANGICNNLLTSIIRGWSSSTPVLVAPAMNTFMYTNPMTKKHIKMLQEDSPYITVLKPVEKVLICGDIGMGGMREWNEIVEILRQKILEIKKSREQENVDDEEDNENNDDDDEDDDEDDDDDDDDDDEDDDDDDDDDDDEDDDNNNNVNHLTAAIATSNR